MKARTGMVILVAAAILVSSAAAFPAFCTRIESGSSIDICSGSLSTTASGLMVTEGIDPVELSYRISLIGIGDTPAQGSANAYIEALIVEGRDNGTSMLERVDFSDYTAVNGQITQFEKILQYRSGFVS